MRVGASPVEQEADRPPRGQQGVRELARDLQQALARRGRAPCVLAGLPMFEELDALQETLAHCLALGDDPQLGHWHQVLRETLPAYRQNFARVQLALDWVQAIGTILPAPVPTAAEPGPGGESVARHRAHYLGALADRLDLSPWLITFREQDLLARSERYWAGLFPCYDLVGLPRPNNDHESLYGQLKRGLRRQRGVKDLREPLRRHGAWLVFRTEAGSAEEVRQRLAQVPWADYLAERSRYEQRQAIFRQRYQWASPARGGQTAARSGLG